MTAEEIKDLWDAIGELNEKSTEVISELRSLNAKLSERCEIRAKALESLDIRIGRLEEKYALLDKAVLKWAIITSIISSGFTLMASKIVGKVLGF